MPFSKYVQKNFKNRVWINAILRKKMWLACLVNHSYGCILRLLNKLKKLARARRILFGFYWNVYNITRV